MTRTRHRGPGWRGVLLAGAVALTAGTSLASPTALAELPSAALRGSGSMRFLGLRVYDARLWSAGTLSPTDWSNTPLLLELEYARDFAGRQIAERSLTEMRRQRDISSDEAGRWLSTMQRLFPDVRAGDRIAGLLQPGQGSRFYVNDRFVGEVRDAAFARLFFGIWLSAQTSEPALREALLGSAR